MTTPAERIHLHMEGLPQDVAESAGFVITQALDFCAQPETFPVFQAYAASKDDPEWVLNLVRTMHPDVLNDVNALVVAGIVADLDGAT